MSYCWPVSRACGAEAARASAGSSISADQPARQRPRVTLRHDDRVALVGEHVDEAVGVGRDDRLPHRQRFEHRQRRALPERRKHAEVEGRDDARDVPREAGEHEPIAESSARACCSSGSRKRSFADDEEPRVRPLVQHEPRGIDEVRIAF